MIPLTKLKLTALLFWVTIIAGIFISGIMPASANIVILSTRVIYPEAAREVNIRIENKGDLPSLIQTWIDEGDASAPVNTLEVPFVLMPPVSRIDGHKGQTLRLAYTGKALPKDKESVFWLNVLDIPPKNSAAAVTNTLQMAIRSRIKIFFRPAGLSAQGALTAAKDLRWSSLKTAYGTELAAVNTSPYHINVSSVTLENKGKKTVTSEGIMIPPGATHKFPMKTAQPMSEKGKITYQIINDFGGMSEFQVQDNARQTL